MIWKSFTLFSIIVCIVCIKQIQSSKSSKRLYELVIERVYLHEGEGLDLVKVHMARISKYNHTSFIFNASATLMEDLPIETTTIEVVAFELLASNKYSMIPVRLGPATNLCAAISVYLARFYPYLVKSSNMPEKCPFLKGDYFVRDYVVDQIMMPMYFPGERWRVDLMIRIATKLRYKFSTYVYINRHI